MIKIGNTKLNSKKEKINTSRILTATNILKNTSNGLVIWLIGVMHKVQLLPKKENKGWGTTEFPQKSAIKNQRTA